MGLDIEPGAYDTNGAVIALVDQQRAQAVDAVRESEALAVTWWNAEGHGTHWGFIGDASEAETFLLYALCKAWVDLAGLVQNDFKQFAMLRNALLAMEEA